MSDTESEEEEQEEELEIGIDGKGGSVRKGQNTKVVSQSSPSLGSSTRTAPRRTGSRSSSRLDKDGSRKKEESLATRDATSEAPAEQGDDDDDCITAEYSQEVQDEEGRRDLAEEKSSKRVKTPPPTSSPLSSATPTPTPTPKKRKAEPSETVSSPRRSTRTTRSRSNTSQQESTPKEVPVSRRRDVTPPRTAPVAGPSTPTSSPRDYAHLFAAISPDPSMMSSPSRKRLIGQTQSSGAVLDSPSKLRRGFSHVYDSPGRSGPSTPTKLLNRTHSMPISPSKPLEDGDLSAMWIKPVEPEGQGSGGRAKRIYGRTRTVVAEDENTVTDAEKLETALSKESYASLRNRYEVNSGEATLSQEELSVCHRFGCGGMC